MKLNFFWPLTEQIPLDLDYTECNTPKLSTFNSAYTGYTLNGSTNASSISIITSNLNLDVETTVFKVAEKPNIIRRGLFSILGIRWVKK